MAHPGHPQFTAVGAGVDLAPRDPDLAATYEWSVVDAPTESAVTLGSDPVFEFVPDAPGTYTLGLEGPDGDHRLTVRAFPESRTRTSPDGSSGEYGFAGGYAEPGAADSSRPRIRLDGRLEGDEVVVEATARSAPDSDVPDAALDVEFVADDRDPLDTATITVQGQTARFDRESIGDRSRLHAVAVGTTYSVADAIAVEQTPDGVTVDRLYDPPAWSSDITLYEVFVRSFAPEDERTFEALEARLPELADFGIDCLWLTPVLQHEGFPHGYNITDFFSIADDLGTRAEFEAFVDACHDHGIKVLFDLVLNHSARDHEFYRRALENDPEYRGWYEWEDEEANEPATYFDWPYIANFNFETLAVRRHLLEVVDEWAPVVDGFRCDMAWAVPTNFWQEIRDRVRTHDAEFLLLDETIPYIPDFHEGCFDVHFDTTLYFALREIGHGNMTADAVSNAIDQRTEIGFPDHAAFLQYIENHDETRYVEECGRAEVEAAAGAIFTLPGTPLLYAGQEIGETERRSPIDWDDADEELYEHYRSLIRLRDDRPELGRDGAFEPVTVEADHEGVVAYARETDGQRSVVVLNFGPAAATVDLSDERVSTTDLRTGADVGRDDGSLTVQSCVVLEASSGETR
jgi:cyclomaltodextrinase / maltogenic alpha-amylase / neopullulanase